MIKHDFDNISNHFCLEIYRCSLCVCAVVLHTNRQISMFQEVYWNRKANNLLEPELCVFKRRLLKDMNWKFNRMFKKNNLRISTNNTTDPRRISKLVVMYISSRYHWQLCSDKIKNSNKNLNIKKTSKMINTMNHELKRINSKLSLFTVKVWLKFTCSKSASRTFAVRSSNNTRYNDEHSWRKGKKHGRKLHSLKS